MCSSLCVLLAQVHHGCNWIIGSNTLFIVLYVVARVSLRGEND